MCVDDDDDDGDGDDDDHDGDDDDDDDVCASFFLGGGGIGQKTFFCGTRDTSHGVVIFAVTERVQRGKGQLRWSHLVSIFESKQTTHSDSGSTSASSMMFGLPVPPPHLI